MHWSGQGLTAPVVSPIHKRRSRLVRLLRMGLQAPAMLIVGGIAPTVAAVRAEPEKGQEAEPPGILVPFVRASHEHTEPAFDETTTATEGSIHKGPHEIPAYGFIRGIWLLVTATGGDIGAAALTADAPHSVLGRISLQDVNSREFVAFSNGWRARLSNRYGGYLHDGNIDGYPGVVLNSINFSFFLYLPLEATEWDAFGALPNLNAAQSYKLEYNINPRSEWLSAAPTTLPNIRVRAFLDAWQQPQGALDPFGNPQEQVPPGVGTTQYWSESSFVVPLGQHTVRLTKTGNLIRNLVFEFRTAAGARSDTVMPDDLEIIRDAETLHNEPAWLRQIIMRKRYGFSPETGVLVYDAISDQDGHAGAENRHRWIPTIEATRLEVKGNFGAAGVVNVLTNDVAPTPDAAAIR